MNEYGDITTNERFEQLRIQTIEFVIICLFFTTIFWGFVAKFLPINNSIYQIINNISDLLPLMTFFLFGKITLKNNNRLNSIYLISLTVIFSGLLILITLLNNGSLFYAIPRLGAIFRFLPLCLLIYSLKFRNKKIILVLFLRLIKFTFIAEIIIGLIEIIGGERTLVFFLPLIVSKNSSAQRVLFESQIFGTFSNTIEYAFFLIAAFSLLIGFQKIKLKSIYTFLSFLTVYYSGSVAGLALLIMLIYYFIEITNKKYILIAGSVILLLVMIRFFSYYQNNLVELYAGLMNSRLGIILFTLPEFLKSGFFNSIFGIGADQLVVYNNIIHYKNVPLIFQSDGSVVALDDVYYVSTIIESGIIGLLLLFSLYFKIYKYSLAQISINDYDIKKLIVFLFFMIASASFFNQILHVRSFTFIFWITIGIISAPYTILNESKNENNID